MKINEYLLTEDELFELKMKSNFLKRRAGKLDLKVGIEFELICPRGDEYSINNGRITRIEDIPSRSLDYVESFLLDYIDDATVHRIINQLKNEHIELAKKQAIENWPTDIGKKFSRDYYYRNIWEATDHADELAQLSKKEYEKQYKDSTDMESFEIAINVYLKYSLDVHDDFFKIIRNSEEKLINHYLTLFSKTKEFEKVKNAYMKTSISGYTQEHYLQEHYPTIHDVAIEFNIVNPLETAYYGGFNDEFDSEEYDNSTTQEDIEYVVSTYSKYTDLYVKDGTRSTQYTDEYLVTFDTSITPHNHNEFGVEIVSPPLILPDITTEIENIQKWAYYYGAYTNDSCGLHINISIQNKTIDDLDYVKLGLLLGDRYILSQFSRELNAYTVSAMENIKQYANAMSDQENEELDIKLNDFLTLMHKKLNKTVSKKLHGIKTTKYTSVNVHDSVDNWRIEFRGPGGDWLNKSIDELTQTIYRCAVALDAAMDEKKYQEEYAKKLYKVLDSVKSPKESSILSKYLAGQISIEDVREYLKSVALQKQTDVVDENT